MTVLATPGERLTCEAGHHIATVAEAIVSDETSSPDQFRDWQIAKPGLGAPLSPCPCGAAYVKSVGRLGTRMIPHIEGEWRNA